MRPPPGASFAQGFTGLIPLEITGSPVHPGPFHCQTKHVAVPSMDDATVLRALGLDPIRFKLDMPPSVRYFGQKSNANLPGGGIRDFRIFMLGQDEPIAIGAILPQGGLRHRAVDPTSHRDTANHRYA